MMEPRGIRNNNPGNIEDGPFARSIPGYVGSDGRFARFETPEAGALAIDRLLTSYGNRGFNTPESIIGRWAPSSDNNPTRNYSAYVAEGLGVAPNDRLDMSDPNVRRAVGERIAQFENGKQVKSTMAAPKPVADEGVLARFRDSQAKPVSDPEVLARFQQSQQQPQEQPQNEWWREAEGPPAPPPSVLQKAAEPITTYPETYQGMRHESQDQMSRGIDQLKTAASGEDIMGYPVNRAWEAAKGAGNLVGGGIGFTASPINAALRTFVGKPVEENTGIPKEYTEFASSLAIPGLGMTKINTVSKAAPAATAGQEVAAAANRLGVDVPRAVATDSMLTQRAAAATRNIPGAGDPLVKASEGTIRQLGEKASEVAQGYGGGTTYGSGEAASGAINQYITGTTADRARKLYDKVDNLVDRSAKVPLEMTNTTAREIMLRRAEAGMDENSKAVGMVITALNKPGGLTYQGLKDLRSTVGEMQSKSILPEGFSSGELKQIYGALSDDLKTAVSVAGGEKAKAAFDRANTYYRLVSDRRESLAKIVGKDGNAPAEQVFDRLVSMAGSGSRADIQKLAQARKAIGADDWNEFASGVISRMGRDPAVRGAPEALQAGDFSPQRFLSAYSKLSDAGRSVLFKSGGKGELAQSLDDIAAISARFKDLQKFANPSGTGQTFAGGGIMAGLMIEPMTTIGGVVGGRTLATILSQPATAASAAQFSRKYELAMRNPSPATVAGLTIASRNLANTLKDIGVSVKPDDFLRAIQGAVKAPAGDEQPEPERVLGN